MISVVDHVLPVCQETEHDQDVVLTVRDVVHPLALEESLVLRPRQALDVDPVQLVSQEMEEAVRTSMR